MRHLALAVSAVTAVFLASSPADAAELLASQIWWNSNLGQSVSMSNSISLVGAYQAGTNSVGLVYLYRDLDTATGIIAENVTLAASDSAAVDAFGYSTSLSGNVGLVGAPYDDDKGNLSGSAYVFRDLDTSAGTVTENVKLIASDGAANDQFGRTVSLSGTTALIGSSNHDGNRGAAYLYRDLDTTTGSATENAKLVASDGTSFDHFGSSVSLSGSIALVGASTAISHEDLPDNYILKGAAYIFRNLDSATGTVTESTKLVASDGAGNDRFGTSVSLSDSIALVGADFKESVYVFRGVDTATGTVTENAKLTASDGTHGDSFGAAVSLSGSTALIGASGYGDNDAGAAYLFRNLDTASGTITESVKITASDAFDYDFQNFFGQSVSLDGDNFVIGSPGKRRLNGSGSTVDRGKAYSGSVSSLTTLDAGNTSRTIDGVSFESREDWIVGLSTDNNTVVLTAGNTANITATGKAVVIGQNAGSTGNLLVIAGTLTANEIHVGSLDGNAGNALRLDDTAAFTIGSIYLAPDNFLFIAGNHTTDFLAYLGDTDLAVWTGDAWQTVDGGNVASLVVASFADGYTTLAAVPEPSTIALLAGGLVLAGLAWGRVWRSR